MYVNNQSHKYGPDKFVIELLATTSSQIVADYLESSYIKEYDSISSPNGIGYNLKDGGSNGKLSQETKDKMSKAHTGKKLSLRHCKSTSVGKTGIPRDNETKQKLSDFFRKTTEAQDQEIKNMYESGISQSRVAELFNVSQKTIGNIINDRRFSVDKEEVKTVRIMRDMSGANNPMFGKHHTPETRKLMSENRDNKGENNSRALFTKELVEAVRNDPRPERTIAKEYGVARSTINSIKRRINWK